MNLLRTLFVFSLFNGIGIFLGDVYYDVRSGTLAVVLALVNGMLGYILSVQSGLEARMRKLEKLRGRNNGAFDFDQ